MSTTTLDLASIAALAAKAGELNNQTVAKAGGDFDNTIPEGNCRLRFVHYIELGKQKGTFQGKPTVKDKVQLGFEISGPKHQPRVLDDGTKLPFMIYIEENLSQSAKANFHKLLTVMNYTGKATHLAQLLGEGYLGTISHRKYAKRGEDKANPATWTGVAAELKPKGGSYTVRPPRVEDAESGDWKDVVVDAPISPLRLFIWNLADMSQWGSLFIEGEWEERKDEKTGAVISPKRSKNIIQQKIASAENFPGSVMQTLLLNNGVNLDLGVATEDDDAGGEEDAGEAQATEGTVPPTAAAVPSGEAADDALNGVA